MNKTKVIEKSGPLGYVFFVAWIGALVYFVQNSEGFGGFLVAILKSFVWPGIVLHEILGIMGL